MNDVENRMNLFKLGFMAILSLLFVSSLQAKGMDPYAYKAFTDFDGKKYSLNDVRGKGKWLIVMVWRHDCHVCNQEVGQYMKFHSKNKDSLATVLGITLDGVAGKKKASAFIKRHKVNFPNLLVDNSTFSDLYRAFSGKQFRGTPTIIIFSRDGTHKGQQPGAVPTSIIEKFAKDNDKK